MYDKNLIRMKNKKRVRFNHVPIKTRRCTVAYSLFSESININVCNQCFLATLGEMPSFLRTIIIKEFKDNEEWKNKDLRGRLKPKNKLSEDKELEILNHTRKFPVFESKYSKNHTSRKYLSSALNVCIMYKLYKKETFKPVSLTTYLAIVKTTKLKFKPPQLNTSKVM